MPLALGRILAAPRGAFAQTNDCGTTLAPGSSCAFRVTFKAVSKGTINGYLILIDNSWPKGLQFVRLAGAGV